MADICYILSLAIVYIVYLGLGDCSSLTDEECRSLGFTSNLVCTSCNMLDEFNLSRLKEDCRKCCTEDSSAFVKSERPNQFPGLEVKYVRGADPEIHLMDDNRNVVETLGIEKWNTDSLEGFLHERLKK